MKPTQWKKTKETGKLADGRNWKKQNDNRPVLGKKDEIWGGLFGEFAKWGGLFDDFGEKCNLLLVNCDFCN